MAQYFRHQTKDFAVGDTLRVHQEIVEGDKKRIQVFEGILIAVKNRGLGKSFTVRKVASGGIGVEKIFPLHLPTIKKIELKRKGDVRRAKLYYLRDRVGKAATRIKEKNVVSQTTKADNKQARA